MQKARDSGRFRATTVHSWLCLLISSGLIASSVFAASGSTQLFGLQDVYDCVALNLPQGGFSHEADIEVRTTRGEHRRLQARIMGKRGDDTLLLNIRLLAPGNVAGTTVLVRERDKKPDDIRMYLPALERTRYISDALSSTRLFDTDFSYADFKQLYGQFSGTDAKYLGIESWRNRRVHVLRILPATDEHQPYSSLITRIDTATCVILGMDFLNTEGQPRRQMRADPDSIQSVQGYHLPGLMTMTDILQGSSTTVKLKNIRADLNLPGFHFEPDDFYRDKPEPREEPPLKLPDATNEGQGAGI